MNDPDRRAAARAEQREWDWSNPRCPFSDLQHPPDEHLPECAPHIAEALGDDEDDEEPKAEEEPPPRPARKSWASKRTRPWEEDYPRDSNGWHF